MPSSSKVPASMCGRLRWALGPKVSENGSISTMWERCTLFGQMRGTGIREELSDEPCASLGSRHRRGAAWEVYCDAKAQSKDHVACSASSCGSDPTLSVRSPWCYLRKIMCEDHSPGSSNSKTTHQTTADLAVLSLESSHPLLSEMPRPG